jgi:putative ABC transport system substrate-binding protein
MRLHVIKCVVMLALPLLVVSLAAEAQPAGKVDRIGYLSLQGEGPSPDTTAFLQGLRDLGYVDGPNLVMAFRFAGGKAERLPDFAVELVRLKVDVLVNHEGISP